MLRLAAYWAGVMYPSDALLNAWQLDTLLETQVLIEDWRIDYGCKSSRSCRLSSFADELAISRLGVYRDLLLTQALLT